MAKTCKHADGEFIDLIWDGPHPDAYYIRGHVSLEKGMRILLEEEVIDEEIVIGYIRHIYGRWSMQGDAPDGTTCVLREYNQSGRGRFKVTKFGL